jgi:hypothetical protein
MAGGAAAQAWQRAQKHPAEFDPSPRMLDVEGPVEDLSAGRWRSILLPGRSWPAVQRQHERRKYLAAGEYGGRCVWKFTGLGPHGEPRYARARALAEAGFIPAIRGLQNGFLVQDFVTGTPLRARDLDRRLAERVVAYVAFRARSFRTGRAGRIADLREMIQVNVSEGLGAEWGDAAERAFSSIATVAEAGTIAVDSRMMPHEWLDTSRGLMKADAIDHADDHFFPRDQDVAWDIAGFAAEFRLTPEREWELCEAVAAATGDRELPRRIRFYAVAYRAFHLGYAELAISALGAEDADAARFRRRAARFATELQSRLGASVPAKS